MTETVDPESDSPSSRYPILEPEDPLTPVTIDDVPDHLRPAVDRQGWTSLMPVQAMAIPYVMAGRDVMVQARTGTGKTAAFVLPILDRIDPKHAKCQALVMVPTRELAKQVCSVAEDLAADLGVRTVAVYGGVGYGPQLDALERGAHLVVGTPGRILDHLMRRSFTLDDLRILIFDEADRMLSVGFYPDMKALEVYLPKDRDGFMFSATFPPAVKSLAKQFLRDPGFLSLSQDGEHVAENTHISYEVPAMDKDRCLVRIIEVENPDSALIFSNTRANANYVAVVLQRFGYDADQLSADLSQKDRERVLGRLRRKELRFLVATDVAARGIDISHLSHVILYDFPEDPESYIHRSGRTGRAGAAGTAISLTDPLERMNLKVVAKRYGITVEQRPLPTEEDVQAIVSERVTAFLEAKLRRLDRLVRERMRRMLPLARSFGDTDDELAVVAMLLDEYYQQTLHALPDLPEPEEETGEAEPAPRRARRDDGGSRRRKRRSGRRR